MPSLRHWLSPGSPDDARAAIQPAAVEAALAGFGLEGRCLNAGAGEGMFAPLIDRQPAVRDAVDIDLGRPYAPSGGRVHHVLARADLQHLPFLDATFDCCLCTEVLEHVLDDRRAVAELARVLRPGAILVVTVPSPPAPPDRAHVREGYELEALTALLGAAGFTVERHAWCFHGVMRATAHTWGRGQRRSWLLRRLTPRVLFTALGRLDAALGIGRPWDLIVIARRFR